MGTGVWLLDSTYRTEYMNPCMARMLGTTPEEMDGAPFLEFIPEDAHTAALSHLEQCRHDSNAHVDLPLQPRQGSSRWVMVSTQALPAASPERASLMCVVIDITDRKTAEEALLKTAAHYRVLAETAEDHIFVINSEDRVEYVNQAAARQLRTVPEQVIGRRRLEIFPPDVAERQGRSLLHVFNAGMPIYVEGRTLYLNREVWLGTWLAPVPDAAGRVRAVLGLSRDITERKRAEDALRTSEQRLRVVLSNVPLYVGHRRARGCDVLRWASAGVGGKHAGRHRRTHLRCDRNRAVSSDRGRPPTCPHRRGREQSN